MNYINLEKIKKELMSKFDAIEDISFYKKAGSTTAPGWTGNIEELEDGGENDLGGSTGDEEVDYTVCICGIGYLEDDTRFRWLEEDNENPNIMLIITTEIIEILDKISYTDINDEEPGGEDGKEIYVIEIDGLEKKLKEII